MSKHSMLHVLTVTVLGLGCAANRHQVRVKLEVEGKPAVVHVPASNGRPVVVPEVELWGAFRQAGRDVVAQVDPLAAAEQTFGVTEQSGTYRYYTRTRRLVEEPPGGGSGEEDDAASEVTRGYLEWCGGTKLGGGDCLRLLGHSGTLTLHGRYVVTLVMGMVSSFEPMLDSLKELANPNAVAVTLASAVAMYLTLWLLPEPISKVIATSITVFLIGYLGFDLFFSLTDGWAALTKAADLAQDFGDLRRAAKDFGQVLGPQVGQVLLLLVSRSLGKGLAAKGPALPRFPEASAQASNLLGVRLGAVAGVRSVAMGAGVITISVAGPALAMANAAGGGGGDSRVRVVQADEWDPPEGGPGKWVKEPEAMSDEARTYQSQVSGAPRGWVYKIGETSFDGYKNGVLIEAKDHYKQFLLNGPPTKPKWFFQGFKGFIEQAQNQVAKARGTRIQWHFAEKEVADHVSRLFRNREDLSSIQVIHTPRAP